METAPGRIPFAQIACTDGFRKRFQDLVCSHCPSPSALLTRYSRLFTDPASTPESSWALSRTSTSSQLPGAAASPSSPEIRSLLIFQASALFGSSLPHTLKSFLLPGASISPSTSFYDHHTIDLSKAQSESYWPPWETTATAPPGPGPCSHSSAWHSRPWHPRLCSCTSRDPDDGPRISIQAPHPAESGVSARNCSVRRGPIMHTAPFTQIQPAVQGHCQARLSIHPKQLHLLLP